MDTTTLDHTPDCTGGTLNTLLFSTQQTLQDAKRQNKPLATSTSCPTNATTTANLSYRPVRYEPQTRDYRAPRLSENRYAGPPKRYNNLQITHNK